MGPPLVFCSCGCTFLSWGREVMPSNAYLQQRKSRCQGTVFIQWHLFVANFFGSFMNWFTNTAHELRFWSRIVLISAVFFPSRHQKAIPFLEMLELTTIEMVFHQCPLDVTYAPVVLGRSTLLWQSWKWLWYENNSWVINIDLKKLFSLLIKHSIFAVFIYPSANKVTTGYFINLTIPNQSKHRGFHEVVNFADGLSIVEVLYFNLC